MLIFLLEAQKLRFRFVHVVFQVGCFKVRDKWEVGIEFYLMSIRADPR